MATPLTKPYNTYIGNDVATEFAINFPYADKSQVHVYLKRYDGEETELSTDDYSFVSDSVVKFPKEGSSEAVLRTNDKLAIQRETPIESDYVFNNQKRLFPEDVMGADDLAFKILQEHEMRLDRAIGLDPTSGSDPSQVIRGVERLYESIDNIDDVAADLTNINNAPAYANLAKQWAIGEPEEPSGGSAKYWAERAVQDISKIKENINDHIADKNNPHEVTKAQVGLSNVDNTSDLNKPISTATQTALNGKQDTISDLSTIRTNALSGASAYATIQGYGDIVTHGVSEFATSAQGSLADSALQSGDDISRLNNDAGYITGSSLTGYATENYVDTGLSGKQAVLVSGTNIKTVNNQSLLGSGNITIGGAVDSVNGRTGAVVLTSSDVGALPASTIIPMVNNSTISFTQGGVSKGSFTLNQSTGATIDLDAGGGSSFPPQTGHAGEFLTTDGTDPSWAVATKITFLEL